MADEGAASDRHGQSEILWQLPRSRRLRREILLHPIFKSLDTDGRAFEHFVQQSLFLLKSFKNMELEALLDATRVFEDELQLFSTFDISDAAPLPSINSYVTYVKDLLPTLGVAVAVAAVALHVRLVHWLCQTFLKADGITSKSFRKWLEFGASHYQPLSLRLDQKLDQQNLNEFRDMYLQLMQHEHSFFSEIATCCHLEELEEANQKALLQVAQIIPPRVLIIAGSDSGGGAGLQADLKSCTVQGVFATTAVTAVTAQNTQGVQGIFPIPIDFLKKQVDSVLSDLGTDVVKTGMLATAEIVKAVAAALKGRLDYLVVDPVMVSTSGHTLLEDDAIQSLKEELFPHATIITPNLPEACLLLGLKEISTVAAMEEAARKLAMMGPQWVLVKGGHLPGNDQAIDILCQGRTGECVPFKSNLVANTKHTHGTGCTLASSIAAHLASGLKVPEAVQAAKDFVTGAIANSAHLALGVGKQGPMNHSWPYFDW